MPSSCRRWTTEDLDYYLPGERQVTRCIPDVPASATDRPAWDRTGPRLFTGTGLSGVWFVFVGWFLIQAAQSEAVAARQRLVLAGRSVRDLMTPDPVTVPPDLTVAEFVER
jgi:hypothetical protein